MTVGLRKTPDSPSVDPDFCVVATSLNRQLPDLRHNKPVRSSARIPLFQQEAQSPGRTRGNHPIPIRVAPFAGQLHAAPCTKICNSSPNDTGGSGTSSGGVGSKSRAATSSVSTADGDSLNSDRCCSKTPGRVPGVTSTEERGTWGRERSTSIAMAPTLLHDPDKTPPSIVSARVSSKF